MSVALSYNEAISKLRHALKFGMNPSLEPIRAMCRELGQPQQYYSCIQVAGSNGKSSTSRMTAALLHAHGRKTGLYTSPHLVRYPERIEIDGKVVDDRLFADGIQAALAAAERAGIEATEFELLTAAALWIFHKERVDVAVLECGLGGRWDATTVVDPRVAVITGVALEHTKILGDTVEKIAAEKAAIIKPDATAVLAADLAASEVFEHRARSVGARLVQVNPHASDDFEIALEHLPLYQRANAATSLTAAGVLLGSAMDKDACMRALRQVVVPGRFEILREQPLLMIDAAHNPQSAQVLAKELMHRFVVATAPPALAQAQMGAGRKPVPTLLLGVLADKDVRGVVEALVPLFDDVVVTASQSPRSISARHLASIVEDVSGKPPRVAPTIAAALDLLQDTPTLATGSITVAGEVKRVWC